MIKFAEDQQKKKEKRAGLDMTAGYVSNSNKQPYELQESYYGMARGTGGAGYSLSSPGYTGLGTPGYFYGSPATSDRGSGRSYYEKPAMTIHTQGTETWYPSLSHSELGSGYDTRSNSYTGSLSPYSMGYGNVSDSSLVDLGHSSRYAGTNYDEPGFSSGGTTLYVSNLPSYADVSTLHELLGPYGRVLSAQVGSGRGQVQMASASQAQYAIHALNGSVMFEGGVPLQVGLGQGVPSRVSVQGGFPFQSQQLQGVRYPSQGGRVF